LNANWNSEFIQEFFFRPPLSFWLPATAKAEMESFFSVQFSLSKSGRSEAEILPFFAMFYKKSVAVRGCCPYVRYD
jgi:hypothetical protein